METRVSDSVPERILIIRLSAIGDVVRTLPALTSLRNQYPQAHIAWAVEDKSSGILTGHPYLDETVTFQRTRIVDSLKRPWKLGEALGLMTAFLRTIRRGRYDIVFDFHGILKSGIVAAWSGAPVRVGFGKGFEKEFNYFFTNRKIIPSDARLPRVSRNLELIRDFVVPENMTDRAVLGLTDDHRKKVASFIQGRFAGSGPLIAIHPGTSRDIKKWPPQSFAALCDLLTDVAGANVMLTWGPGELDEVKEIRSSAKSSPEIGMETQSLLELAAVLEACDLMVTVDSGPMHIGSVVGTPVVAIFGPTDIQVNAPYWQPNRVVSSDMDCCPCDENCERNRCMEEVHPETVLEAARELLPGAPAMTMGEHPL